MNRLFLLLVFGLIFGLCVSGVNSAHATPVYSQTFTGGFNGAFGSSDAPIAQKVADNFLINGDDPIEVRSLRVRGGYVRAEPPRTPPTEELPNDSFRIVFLEDNSGTPDSPVVGGDFTIESAVFRSLAGGEDLNGLATPIDFVIDLGNGVTLNSDQEYWISITNNPEMGYGWLWARAAGVLDFAAASTIGTIAEGPWDVVSSDGLWFELNDQNIPEPTSLILILMGCSSAILGRRCRDILQFDPK